MPEDFLIIDITVTFDEMGGSEIDDLVVQRRTMFTPEQVPTKEGYVFDGWYLDDACMYEASFSTGFNDDVTLYAKWLDETNLYDIEDVRAIINDILDVEHLTIADQQTVEGIVTDIITSGDYIDEQSLVDLVLAELDIVDLLDAHISEMLSVVRQSVVFIEASSTFSGATGSGIIFNHIGNNYYVLTNNHVVEGFNNFTITIFDDSGEVTIQRFFVDLVQTSMTHDLAVLRFTSTGQFNLLPLGQVNDLAVGQMVFAVGSPLDLPDSTTMGIISAIDRPMTYTDEDSNTNTISIQHDAAISPGNSGGALVNIYGELIGINFLSYVDEEVGEGVEGLHFAIQIDIVRQMLTTWGLMP